MDSIELKLIRLMNRALSAPLKYANERPPPPQSAHLHEHNNISQPPDSTLICIYLRLRTVRHTPGQTVIQTHTHANDAGLFPAQRA